MKRVIRIFSILALAAALLPSCAREQLAPASGPASRFLALNVSCADASKTEINAGKTTWEAGDEIAVLYDGSIYKYSTSTAGATATFTSESGITEYDSSKQLEAYYPSSVTDGVFEIPSEMTVSDFAGKTTIYAAKPQLIGRPGGVVTSGTLPVHFKNVSSVLELAFDACPKVTSPVASISIAPADEASFSGQLSFKGTVDYENLKLTASTEGSSIVLNFGEGLDMNANGYKIKLPVGRFDSPAGLYVTLTTKAGDKFAKNVYKDGVSSYSASGDKVVLKHLAKALFPFEPAAKVIEISTLADLKAFAAAVNAQDGTESMSALLLNDINMAGESAWTPIGNAATASITAENEIGSMSYTGAAFKGIFEGNGKKITNFNQTISGTGVYGLFGVLDGAEVKNLTISGQITAQGTGELHVGSVAGIAKDSKITNCTTGVNAVIQGGTVNNKRVAVGGVVGGAYSSASDKYSQIANCTNSGKIVSAVKGTNTSTGKDCVMFGGIAGVVTSPSSGVKTLISKCSNSGTMGTSDTDKIPLSRCSGIVATVWYTKISECSNSGAQYNNGSSGRIGQIASYAYGCELDKCVNSGKLTTTQDNTENGGLVGLLTGSSTVTGGENSGDVISACTTVTSGETMVHRGLLFANMASFTSVSGVTCSGGLYDYKGSSTPPSKIAVNSSNYMNYIGRYKSADASKITNIIWSGEDPPAAGISTADELKEFRDLVNSGGDYSKFVSDGSVNLLNDISLAGSGAWTPIGNGNIADDGTVSGRAFTGKFNGNGHTISGFPGSASSLSNAAYGFFGALDGATVRNLTLTGSFKVSAAGAASVGVIAGVAKAATVSDVTTAVAITVNGTTASSARFIIGGIVGQIVNIGVGTKLTNCHVKSNATIQRGSNGNNGTTGVQFGGIVGYINIDSGKTTSTTDHTVLTSCVNDGSMTADNGRCAGIVASCEYYCKLVDCINNGTQTNSSNKCRLGQIAGNFGAGGNCRMDNCVNNGDIICSGTPQNNNDVRVGGLVGGMSKGSIYGGASNGRVIARLDVLNTNVNTGLVFAYISDATAVQNVQTKGLIGKYLGADSYEMITVTSENLNVWSSGPTTTSQYCYLGACNSSKTSLVTGCTLVK